MAFAHLASVVLALALVGHSTSQHCSDELEDCRLYLDEITLPINTTDICRLIQKVESCYSTMISYCPSGSTKTQRLQLQTYKKAVAACKNLPPGEDKAIKECMISSKKHDCHNLTVQVEKDDATLCRLGGKLLRYISDSKKGCESKLMQIMANGTYFRYEKAMAKICSHEKHCNPAFKRCVDLGRALHNETINLNNVCRVIKDEEDCFNDVAPFCALYASDIQNRVITKTKKAFKTCQNPGPDEDNALKACERSYTMEGCKTLVTKLPVTSNLKDLCKLVGQVITCNTKWIKGCQSKLEKIIITGENQELTYFNNKHCNSGNIKQPAIISILTSAIVLVFRHVA